MMGVRDHSLMARADGTYGGQDACHAWEDDKQGGPFRRWQRSDSCGCMGPRWSGYKEEFIELVQDGTRPRTLEKHCQAKGVC